MYDIYVYIYIYHKPRIEDLPQFFGAVLDQPLRQADAQRLPHGFARGLEGVFEKWLMCVCFSECVYVYIKLCSK